MKKVTLFLLFIFFISPYIYSEGFIGAGGGAEFAPAPADPVTPLLFAEGGIDIFTPIDQTWSFFADAGGRFNFYPVTLDFGGHAFIKGNVSSRGEILFLKFFLSSFFEHTTSMTLPYLKNSIGTYLSLDFPQVSIISDPRVSWIIENGAHTVEIDGTIGPSFGFGSVVFTPKVQGKIGILPTSGLRKEIGALVDLSFYPGIPLTVSVPLGIRRTVSDYTEPIVTGGDALPVDNSLRLYWAPSVLAYIGPVISLEVILQGSFSVFDYPFVDPSGSLGTVPEFRLYAAPQAIFTADFSEIFALRLTAELAGLYSNSDYLNSLSVSTELSAVFSF